MKASNRFLLGALVGLVILTTGFWSNLSGRDFHYAVHTLSADAGSLALARQAGFDTVVQLFSWRQIEPTPGQYHWQYPDEVVRGATYYGLDLVVRLDQHPSWASPVSTAVNAPPEELDDYISFVSAVAARYRGRVKGYIIWNEPNLAQEWGGRRPDPAEYVAMLRAAHEAVKTADPAALVVSAGLASTNSRDASALDDRLYLKEMYEIGALPYFDVLGAHPYGFAYPPDDPRGAHDGLNMARLEDLREIMWDAGDGDKPVWATELGWTVEAHSEENAWQVVTLQQQADYLVGALTRARREWPWLELVAVWNLDGPETSQWSGYSLMDADGQPRPAYRALETLDKGRPMPPLYNVLTRASAYWVERWGRPRHRVLAEDAVIHLGDSQFSDPWMPLYRARNPSPTWQGTVYIPYPGQRDWRLSLRVMQSNTRGNHVWINGQRLDPAIPSEDYSGSWISYTVVVPAALLRPGPNQVAVTVGQTIPLLRDVDTLDDLQIKDVILWR